MQQIYSAMNVIANPVELSFAVRVLKYVPWWNRTNSFFY